MDNQCKFDEEIFCIHDRDCNGLQECEVHRRVSTTAGPSESSGLMVAPRANSSSTPTRFTAGPDGRPNDSSKDKGGLDCLDDDCNKCNHYHFFLCPGK